MNELFNPEKIRAEHLKYNTLPEYVLPITWEEVEPKMKGKSIANNVCGYIHDGMVYFFYSSAKQLWEQNKQEVGCEFKELELCMTLFKKLLDQGDNPHTEVHNTYGRIDILTKTCIYEVKYNPNSHAFLMALGQLLAYSKDYPTHKLFFASNRDISKYELRFKKLFESFNIEVIQI